MLTLHNKKTLTKRGKLPALLVWPHFSAVLMISKNTENNVLWNLNCLETVLYIIRNYSLSQNSTRYSPVKYALDDLNKI